MLKILVALGFLTATVAQSQPLTVRATDNLVAFTKLLGYVRYFHPSDEAALANWETFTLNHITDVEGLESDRDLAAALEALFKPYAPTLEVFVEGDEPALNEALTAERDEVEKNNEVRLWVHSPHGNEDGYSGPVRLSARPGRPYTAQLPSGVTTTIAVPYPRDVMRLSLAPGVQANLARSLYTDETGTLPHAAPPPAKEGTEGDLSEDNRAFRLATVALTWNLYQHFFPYFDDITTDWEAVLRSSLARAATDDESSFLTTYKLMTAQLHDNHTASYRLDQTRDSYRPLFTWRSVGGRLVVVYTDENSPLQLGDVVVSIDGVPTEEALRAKEVFLSQTGDYARQIAEVRLLLGEENSLLELEVRRATGEAVRVEVTRTVDWVTATNSTDARPAAPITDLGDGVTYVDLTRLEDDAYPNSSGQPGQPLRQLITRLAESKGIIFDLRGYPGWTLPIELFGHLSDTPLQTAPLFMPVITQPDGHDIQFVDISYTWAEPKTLKFTDNVVFLIDSSAVSRAEHIIGIAECYKLGDLVGTTTAGANGTFAYTTFFNRYRTSWTSLKAERCGGKQLFALGIPPTLPVERTLQGVLEGQDEVLARALAVVQTRLSK